MRNRNRFGRIGIATAANEMVNAVVLMKKCVDMKRVLVVAIMVVGMLPILSTFAAADGVITVNTTADAVVDDAICSLREAVVAANTDSAFNGCAAGSGVDRIEFDMSLVQPVVITLTLAGLNEDNSMSGDLDIIEDVTIAGLGVGQTIIDGDGADRLFDIRPSAHVTITNMSIQNGNPGLGMLGGGIRVDTASLVLTDVSVSANQSGGISNDSGILSLSNVTVVDNVAGYGVLNQDSASLTFNNGVVSGNQGGGIYNAASTATIDGVDVLNNSGGGGLYNLATTSLTRLTMTQSRVIGNTAVSGAGIYNEGINAIVDIATTQISENVATGAGGGVLNNGIMTIDESTIDHNQARSGAGINHIGGSLSLTNDTISNNDAADNGGGLYSSGSATLTNVTLNANLGDGPDTGGNLFNDGASIIFRNTIVANSPADGNCFNDSGFINSSGNNLDSANSCGFNAVGDIVNSDPLLGVLQDNGGATWTHALLAGSPAINTGENSFCPTIDQRGIARPQATICDIGAYEAVDFDNFVYLPWVIN